MTAPPDSSSVDTKCLPAQTFGNDGALPAAPFGKDKQSAPVDTKLRTNPQFGNDAIGFIRVRKRSLKGGHPDHRRYRSGLGKLQTGSMSFDLVRAMRVNGKPRHEFVLGLGSQKNVDWRDNEITHFWARAVRRMIDHGLVEHQRQRLIAEMVRKGARLPPRAQCEQVVRTYPDNQVIGELLRWLQSRESAAEREAP
jgi:hypothetical protein